MSVSAQMGDNRTGIIMAGARGEAMIEAPREFPPSSAGNAQALADVRAAYARRGDSLGDTPPPSTLVDKAKAAVTAVGGGQPTLLMDKLGERLAFEHAGARLYETLVSKHEAYGSFSGGPSAEELIHILTEEYEHGDLLQHWIKQLGGDPTALTPSANLAVNISAGLPPVLADPRTNLLQCLEAIVVAELADNECWSALEELASQAGHDELASACQQAIAHERDHLENVRRWIAAGHGREGVEGAPAPRGQAAATAEEEFTFEPDNPVDREGYVISDEEVRERQAGGAAAEGGKSGKSSKKRSRGRR